MLREPAGAVEPILFPGLTDGANDRRLGIDTGGQGITQMASSSTNTSTQILDGFAYRWCSPSLRGRFLRHCVTIGQMRWRRKQLLAGLTASGNNNVSGFKMMLSTIARTSFDIASKVVSQT